MAILLPTGPAWTGASWPTACGLAMHAYCIGLIASGGFMQAGIARIDPPEPALVLQRRPAKLRRDYAVGGLPIGLPWWFLAATLLVVLTRGAILDRAPAVIGIRLAVARQACWRRRGSIAGRTIRGGPASRAGSTTR